MPRIAVVVALCLVLCVLAGATGTSSSSSGAASSSSSGAASSSSAQTSAAVAASSSSAETSAAVTSSSGAASSSAAASTGLATSGADSATATSSNNFYTSGTSDSGDSSSTAASTGLDTSSSSTAAASSTSAKATTKAAVAKSGTGSTGGHSATTGAPSPNMCPDGKHTCPAGYWCVASLLCLKGAQSDYSETQQLLAGVMIAMLETQMSTSCIQNVEASVTDLYTSFEDWDSGNTTGAMAELRGGMKAVLDAFSACDKSEGFWDKIEGMVKSVIEDFFPEVVAAYEIVVEGVNIYDDFIGAKTAYDKKDYVTCGVNIGNLAEAVYKAIKDNEAAAAVQQQQQQQQFVPLKPNQQAAFQPLRPARSA